MLGFGLLRQALPYPEYLYCLRYKPLIFGVLMANLPLGRRFDGTQVRDSAGAMHRYCCQQGSCPTRNYHGSEC